MKSEIHVQVLTKLKDLLLVLSDEAFTRPNKLLSNSTIGQHFRHIMEFYLCLFNQMHQKKVNYDLRQRDTQLETNRLFGIQILDHTLTLIDEIEDSILTNNKLYLDNCFHELQNDIPDIPTSFIRELTYCLDYCIHHQSLIKIGLKEQELQHLIDEDFGVAFSTLEHRKK